MPNILPNSPSHEIVFTCVVCRGPLTGWDMGECGLRPPDFGETVDEYCDRELLNPRDLRHLACLMDEGQQAS
jgi:hypothetical protein